MGQRLLQGQALLEHVPLHDALEQSRRELPAGSGTVASKADERRIALVVVPHDLIDTSAVTMERIAVSGQDGIDLEPPDTLERRDVVVERVRARLRMQADVWADLREQVVAGEEHAARRPVKTAMAG